MATGARVDIFMPLYVSDYDRDTADLSFEEHGFYLAILRALWTRDGILDGSDRTRLARVLRTDVQTMDRLWPSVERFFTVEDSGVFHQGRLRVELQRAKQLRLNASLAGRASVEARSRSTTVPTDVTTTVGTEQATEWSTGHQPNTQREGQRNVNTSPSPTDSLSGNRSDPTLRSQTRAIHGSVQLRPGPVTGIELCRVFGEIRSRDVGGMEWQSVNVANGKASTMAEAINETPGAREDVVPTIGLLFAKAKRGEFGPKSADALRDPSFAFGAWCSRWTQLREEIRGISPKVPDPERMKRESAAAKRDAEVEATNRKLARDRNFTPMTPEQLAEMQQSTKKLDESKAVPA